MRNLFVPLLLTLIGSGVAAHDGHGFSGVHWHASDLFGPAVALAVGAAAVWWTRRK
jgi:hypothetical protein